MDRRFAPFEHVHHFIIKTENNAVLTPGYFTGSVKLSLRNSLVSLS